MRKRRRPNAGEFPRLAKPRVEELEARVVPADLSYLLPVNFTGFGPALVAQYNNPDELAIVGTTTRLDQTTTYHDGQVVFITRGANGSIASQTTVPLVSLSPSRQFPNEVPTITWDARFDSQGQLIVLGESASDLIRPLNDPAGSEEGEGTIWAGGLGGFTATDTTQSHPAQQAGDALLGLYLGAGGSIQYVGAGASEMEVGTLGQGYQALTASNVSDGILADTNGFMLVGGRGISQGSPFTQAVFFTKDGTGHWVGHDSQTPAGTIDSFDYRVDSTGLKYGRYTAFDVGQDDYVSRAIIQNPDGSILKDFGPITATTGDATEIRLASDGIALINRFSNGTLNGQDVYIVSQDREVPLLDFLHEQGIQFPHVAGVPDVQGNAQIAAVSLELSQDGKDYNMVVAVDSGTANRPYYAIHLANLPFAPGNQVAQTSITDVSGSGVTGGTGSVTATLHTGSTVLAGKGVTFTLTVGASTSTLGVATTGSDGVALLSNVTLVGVPAGSYTITASYAGDANTTASSGSGSLVVSQATTSLTSVSGTGIWNGTGNVTATLLSGGSGLSGRDVSFTLTVGASTSTLGVATTGTDGLASLSNVNLAGLGAGSYTVTASYAGDVNTTASSGSGSLVVSQATTSLTSVSGTGVANGIGGASATLQSGGVPLSGRSVTFTLTVGASSSTFGVATTDVNGVASLSNVSLAGLSAGSFTLTASYAGDANTTASNGVGSLVVSTAPLDPTTLTGVGGTGVWSGTGTVEATLRTGSAALPGEDVTFTLVVGASSSIVGVARTGSDGKATLSNVSLIGLPAGSYTLQASYAGDVSTEASHGTGALIVSPAATSLTSVGGAGVSNGTGSVTATLRAGSLVLAGRNVTFTLTVGAFSSTVGVATTGSDGVATLTNVNLAGFAADSYTLRASYAGDANTTASNGSGVLVVGPPVLSSTSLSGVSGTGVENGTGRLTAMLQSDGAPLSGRMVTFFMTTASSVSAFTVGTNGSAIGMAMTDASGIALLTNLDLSGFAAGNYGIKAVYAGDASTSASDGTGMLVVAPAVTVAPTSLSGVSGSGVANGIGSVAATLRSGGTVLSDRSVTFTLVVGTTTRTLGVARTGTDGVATLTNVNLAGIAAGSYTLRASYAGDAGTAPSNGSGTLVVTPVVVVAPTSLHGVGGLGVANGTAVLMATLDSNGHPVPGKVIVFSLTHGGHTFVVGTAVTNSGGTAVLRDVSMSGFTAGAFANAVSAKFVGDVNTAASSASGLLIVAPAVVVSQTAFIAVGGVGIAHGFGTLTATLRSNGHALSGKSVTFSLTVGGHTSVVGSAVTNSNGTATLTNVSLSGFEAGIFMNAVGVKYDGDSHTTAARADGVLVVAPAITSFKDVSGSGAVGGTATLNATLISGGKPVAGKLVVFTIVLGNRTFLAGTAVTASNGRATLTNVSLSGVGPGTFSEAVRVSYSGDAGTVASKGRGDLVVTSAPSGGSSRQSNNSAGNGSSNASDRQRASDQLFAALNGVFLAPSSFGTGFGLGGVYVGNDVAPRLPDFNVARILPNQDLPGRPANQFSSSVISGGGGVDILPDPPALDPRDGDFFRQLWDQFLFYARDARKRASLLLGDGLLGWILDLDAPAKRTESADSTPTESNRAEKPPATTTTPVRPTRMDRPVVQPASSVPIPPVTLREGEDGAQGRELRDESPGSEGDTSEASSNAPAGNGGGEGGE